MKEVLVRTKPKDSFILIVPDSSANIQITSNPPLYLQANRNCELAMVNTIRSNGVLLMVRLGQFSTYLQDARKGRY